MTKLVLVVLLAILVSAFADGYGGQKKGNNHKLNDMHKKFSEKENSVPYKVQAVGGRAMSDDKAGTIDQDKYGQKQQKFEAYGDKKNGIEESVDNYGYGSSKKTPKHEKVAAIEKKIRRWC